MATRGRGGRINPIRPPRLITGRVYEQFKPMSEWRQEDDYDTLLIYLPGFQKEYIKVTTEDGNIVRVRGERWIVENRWSQFQEDYRVPENCDMKRIRAKFDGGILLITMPRQITNAHQQPQMLPQTQPQPPPPPPPQPQPPPPPQPPITTQLPPKNKEQPSESTKQKALPNPKQEPKENKPDKPQASRSDDHTLPPPPATVITDTQLVPKTKEQPFKRTKQDKDEVKEKKPDKPKATPLESYTLPPQPKPTSSSTPTKQEPLKPTHKEKEAVGSIPSKQDKHYVEEKPTVREETELDQGVTRGGFWRSEHKDDKQVIGGSWMMNEDRKALLNVGVGVLVIVALGVHVSYTLGLISKGK